MDHGWIKIHRSILTWEWYDDINTCRLFFHLLIRANHKTKKWRKISIERGSFLTSYPKLAEETGLTYEQVRYSLRKLKATREVTVKVTVKYSMVSICNYERYQIKNELKSHSRSQIKSQDSHRIVTPNKKERTKEIKKRTISPTQKKFTKPTKAELDAYCKKMNYDVNTERFLSHYNSNGWKVGKNPMKSWEAALKTWHLKKLEDSGKEYTTTRELLGFRYKCPSCGDVTVEREFRPEDQFDAYTCKVDGCTKTQLINKEMIGSNLLYIEKVYKEES